MSLKLEVGGVYPITDGLKTGITKQNKKYAFFRVKADRGTDAITVWVNNPEAAKNATAVKILSIDTIGISNTKKNMPGMDKPYWYKNYDASVTVEAAAGVGSWKDEPDDDELNKIFGAGF